MSQSSNVPIIQCPSHPMSQSSNVPVIQCPSHPMSQSSNVPVIQCISHPIFQSYNAPVVHYPSHRWSFNALVVQGRSCPRSKSSKGHWLFRIHILQCLSHPRFQSPRVTVIQVPVTQVPIIQGPNYQASQSSRVLIIQSARDRQRKQCIVIYRSL